MKQVVIVGANHSGISAAVHLSKNPEFKVTLLEASDFISFVGAEALLWVLGIIKDPSHMGYTNPKKIQAKGIDLRLNSPVVDLDFVHKSLTYLDLNALETDSNVSISSQTPSAETPIPDGGVAQDTAKTTITFASTIDPAIIANPGVPTKIIKYDYLILATGSRPLLPAIENTHHKYTQTVKNLHDGKALKHLADNPDIQSVAVIGGGYIGVETAEALAHVGKKVTIYQSDSQLLTGFYDSEIIELLHNRLLEHHVQIKLNHRVDSLDDIEADAFIFALGFRANTALGGEQIARLDLAHCYLVDEFQKTNQPQVYAIGDCASSFNNVTREPTYYALGSNTSTTALIAAHHIMGIKTPNLGRQGANAIDVFNLKLCSVGITLQTALANGMKADASTCMDQLKQEDFIENNSQVHISVVYETETNRLLGVQLASDTDVSEILHLFSLAIQEGLTLEHLKYLDMFFHPTLNKLYNFVIKALHFV
ncbi:MAG: FAD-dependent oxidoreductase [Bifidobacteriaceae bacterium]|nr:FAD-dependent oxidoreductase [Bifidobacteriaceae bacterium]